MTACPRCGQSMLTGPARVCDACRARERDAARAEPMPLFTPAPAALAGQETMPDAR